MFSSVFKTGFRSLNPLESLQVTARRFTHEYAPRFKNQTKKQKGRVPVRTGGSTKGNSLQFGQFGLRLKSEGVRLTALQLKEADNAIMRYVRPLNNGQLWRRLCTNIAAVSYTHLDVYKRQALHWCETYPRRSHDDRFANNIFMK